jgi:GxxExxY protein
MTTQQTVITAIKKVLDKGDIECPGFSPVSLPQPVEYKGIRLDCGYRIDVLVEDALILELKSVEEIKGIHEAQLLTYMKLADVKIGLLINFNVTKLKDGIERFVL